MRTRLVARLALAAALLACDGTPTTGVPDDGVNIDPNARIATVAVVPTQVTVSRGRSVQLLAQLRDATGATIIGPSVRWASSNNTVAIVGPSGEVTALGDGVVNISASAGGLTANSVVAVVEVPVATVTLDPAATTMYEGQEAVISATTRDAFGVALSGRFIAWTSSDPAVATISPLGLLTARAPGAVTITATSEGRSATAQVTVLPTPVASLQLSSTTLNLTIPQTAQLSVTPRDARGNVLTGRTVTWSSNNAAVATASPTGLVTATGFGTAAVTATVEGLSASASINVAPAGSPAASLSPTAATVIVDRTVQLTATLRDGVGNVIPGASFSWTSSNTAVAGVSSQGVVTALAAGSATVTATSQGTAASATITVVPVPVASVTVTPNPGQVMTGGVGQFFATARDADGNVLSGRTVLWQSGNTALATVSGSGVVAGVSPGVVTIQATIEGSTGSTSVTILPPPVASVTLSATTVSLTTGQVTTLTATPRDANGAALSGRTIAWQSANAGVAALSAASGATVTVTGGATGSTVIRATSEGQFADATVNVVGTGDATPRITPTSAALTVGQSTTLTAEMVDAGGAVVPGAVFTWSTSNLSVATVSSTGLVTATGAGSASITATSQGRSATAQITVTPVAIASVTLAPASATVVVGGTQAFSATPRDAGGNPLTGRTCSYSSGNSGVMTANAVTGVGTGVSAGTTQMFATCEGVLSTPAQVTVNPVPVSSVQVTASVSTLQVGQTVTMAATPRDAAGNALTGRAVTWSSTNPAAATVSGTGLVTAVAPGTAEIRATSEGVTGAASLTVTQVPVAVVAVGPSTATLVVGQSTTLSAVTRDASGATLTGRTVTWSSANPAIATVNAAGTVTAVAPGTVTISAVSEGRTGTSQVTVVPVPVGSVTVTPATVTLESGTTAQLTATVRDASGNVLTGRVCTWSTNTTIHAGVSPTGGLVTAFNPGEAVITATCEGVSGTAAVSVIPAPVATLSLTPTTLSLTTGQSGTITATARDARGTLLSGRTVTWSSSAPGVATVSSSGTVTAVAVGTATITATSEGVSATTAVTVTLPVVATVAVTPTSATLAVAATLQLIATARDAQGATITGRAVTWNISDTTIARITTAGLVTAVAAGVAIASATIDGVQGTAAITVGSGGGSGTFPISSITLSPTSATLAPGGTQQFAATARNSSGDPLSGPTFTWSSSDPAVVSVDGNGLATAVSAGTATVRATSQTVTGSAGVTVTTGGTVGTLMNKDFENGIWAPMDNAFGTPSGPHAIVTDAANCLGSRCYRYAIPGADLYAVNQWLLSPGRGFDEIYWRYEFKITNIIRGQLKGTRFVDTNSGDIGGMYFMGRAGDGSSGMGFAFASEASGVQLATGIWFGPRSTQFTNAGGRTWLENAATDGRYHRVLIHYQRNGTAQPRARFWVDGVPVVQPQGAALAMDGYTWGASQGGANWVNGNAGEPSWLVPASRGSNAQLAGLRMFDQMSSAGNSGFIYIDNIVVSSQPIQP